MGKIKSAGECLTELGLDVWKKYIGEKIDERKLKSELKKYIETQREYFEISSLTEEFDFQGLVDFIKSESLTDIENRIFSVKKADRKQARESIINKAVFYAEATHKDAKEIVAKIVATCLDILRNFYRKKFSKKDYIMAADIVDAVSEEVERIVGNETKKIVALKEDQEKNSSLSIENVTKLAAQREFETIKNEFNSRLKHMSVEHPLYPHYGYIFQNGDFRSFPITDEAKTLYPQKYVFKGKVRAKDKVFTDASENPFDYAYRHQLNLTMDVSEARKLLGETLDPIQSEVEGLVGGEIQVSPPPFPPAFPCSIKVGDIVYFPYVMFRTQEILDDGTFVIGNKEQQNSYFYFEIQLNLKQVGKCDFKIKLQDQTSAEALNTAKFMKDVSDGKIMQIYALSQNADFITGKIFTADYKTGFASIEEEIDFYERICAIEKRFNVLIKVEGDIYESDYNLIKDISDLAMGKEVISQWDRQVFTCTIDSHFREVLTKFDESPCIISFIAGGTTTILGTQIEMLFRRTYRCASIVDVEKAKKIAELLDDGESIRITFSAGEDTSCVDVLDISEEEENRYRERIGSKLQ